MQTVQNQNVRTAQFAPEQFRTIAALNPHLRIEQVRGIHVSSDGSQITLATTASGARIADKRALGTYEHNGDHALDTFGEVEGVRLLAGTPGIDKNLALPSIGAAIKGLFTREGKSVLVCSKPSGQIAYYLYANPTAQPVDLTELGMDFAQVAYMPKPRGFVAREAGSNRLYFLPWEQARRGETSRSFWKTSNPLSGVKAITALPARIQDARTVLCQTVEVNGAISTDTLNLAGIGNEQITSVARESGTDDVAFRCFADPEVAIVEVGKNNRGLQQGTYQVPAAELPKLFGKAGAKLVQAQTAI